MSACTTQRPLLQSQMRLLSTTHLCLRKGLCSVHTDMHALHTGFYLMQVSEYLSYDLVKELQTNKYVRI